MIQQDIEAIIESAKEALAQDTKPARRGRPKKVAPKARAKVKAAPKAAAPAAVAAPKKLPKTRLLDLRFRGDTVEMTFRDLRKLKTPLKYLDKRLAKLSSSELRKNVVDRAGKTITWPALNLSVDVAQALRFEA